MIFFKNDYNTLGSPEILSRLFELCSEDNIGYGLDKHTKNAINLIKKEIENAEADIYFLSGGTITNKVGVSSLLKPYEAVICANTGHINVHETGAVEDTGHKILTIPSLDGKIKISDIKSLLKDHRDFHKVKPRAVYISESTEQGTTYTLNELKELYSFCQNNNLYLFIDGARLGVALEALNIRLKDIASVCDMFYIGGTKNGAPLGEALIILNDNLKEGFNYLIKNQGALLAKGFLSGIIFECFFENGLYYKNAHISFLSAKELRKVFKKHHIEEAFPNLTNQIFVKLDKEIYEKIKNDVLVEISEEYDTYYIIRFVTNINTKKEDIEALDDLLNEIL